MSVLSIRLDHEVEEKLKLLMENRHIVDKSALKWANGAATLYLLIANIENESTDDNDIVGSSIIKKFRMEKD